MARKIFEGTNIKAYGFPSIGFEQYRVESGLDQRLNQLLSFATGKTEDVSKIKAYEYAAENPLKVSQYLNADPQKRLELLPKGSNVYDATVRAAQVNFMAADVQMAASKKMSELEMNATTFNYSEDQYMGELNAIVEGYTKSFLEIDAEGAVTVKAKLATMANTSYNSFLSTKIKENKAIKDSVTKEYATESVNNIAKSFVAYGPTVKIYDDTDPDNPILEREITIDEHLNLEKDRVKAELILKGYKNIDTWSSDWDKEVIKQKMNFLTTFYDQPDIKEDAEDAVKIVDEVTSGNFNGNKGMQQIYNSLPENEQREFRKQAREFRDLIIADEEKREKAKEIDNGTVVSNMKIDYYQAKLDNDYPTAKKIVDEMKKIDKDVAVELIKDLEEEETAGGFIDPEIYLGLEIDLVSGTLSNEDVNAQWNDRKITSKQKSFLILGIEKRKSAAFKTADAQLKKAIGYPETDLVVLDENKATDEKFEVYRIASGKLYEHYINNPGISVKELRDFAATLVDDQTVINERKILIQKSENSLLNYKTTSGKLFSLASPEFIKFVKASDPDLNNITTFTVSKTFLYSSDNLRSLKRIIQNIKMIPEGGMIEDKFDFGTGLRDETISRPGNMTNDDIDLMIGEIDKLIGLYEREGR
jgi:hypothetical protein